MFSDWEEAMSFYKKALPREGRGEFRETKGKKVAPIPDRARNLFRSVRLGVKESA